METKNKLLAAISYIWIFWIAALIFAKDDTFARFHANQGLLLFIADIAVTIVGNVLEFILGGIGGIIYAALGIVIFVFFIMGIVNAIKGEMKPLPLIGGIEIIK